MSGTIYLIVEEREDAKVVEAILLAKQIIVPVYPLYPSHGSISRLTIELKDLIATAIAKRQPGDCIAVLHDADKFKEARRENYQRIQTICRRYSKDVVHIIAHDEIEAWLLADEGICRWLEIRQENQDSRQKPEDYLKSLVKRKTGKDYSGPNRAKVRAQIDGNTLSPSLRQALNHLDNAPCVGTIK